MPLLKFSIIGQNLIAEPFKEKIIANSVNYLEVEFSFDNASDDWDGLDKFAEFIWDKKSYIAELQTQLKFFIPWQVIKTPGFTVSVFGRKKSTTGNITTVSKQITTELIPVKVYPSGNLQGLFSDEETNEVYIAVAEEALDNSEKALKMAMDSAAKVDQLRLDIDNISKEIEDVLKLTDKFNAFVKKVDTALITQNQAIKGLEQTTKEHEEKLRNLNNEVSSLREDIQNLLLKDSDFENRFIKIQEDFNVVSQNFATIIADLQKLYDDIQQQEEKIQNLEINAQNAANQIEKLKVSDTNILQQLTLLRNDIGELQRDNEKPVSKEDTDFIFYINLNLVTDFYAGALNLENGTVIENEEYRYSNYIEGTSSVFTTNQSNFDVCFYEKIENTTVDEETLEETITTEYSFISSTTITDFTINNENRFCLRVSVPVDTSYSFNLQAGDTYKEESSYYQFDYSLESAIYKLIDDKVGTIINADY